MECIQIVTGPRIQKLRGIRVCSENDHLLCFTCLLFRNKISLIQAIRYQKGILILALPLRFPCVVSADQEGVTE